MILLDGVSQEARHIVNPCLDVFEAKTVLVNKALVVFKPGFPVTAYAFTGFEDPANTIKTTLNNLPYHDHLDSFSVCNLANRMIILSGGEDETGAYKLVCRGTECTALSTA